MEHNNDNFRWLQYCERSQKERKTYMKPWHTQEYTYRQKAEEVRKNLLRLMRELRKQSARVIIKSQGAESAYRKHPLS